MTVEVAESRRRKKKSSVVKKGAVPPPQSSSSAVSCSKPVPGIHYHLNMKDVPFVVGTVSI